MVELGIDQPLRGGETIFVKFSGDLWAQMEMEKTEGLWRPAVKVDLENVPLWKTSRAAPIVQVDAGRFLPSSFSLDTMVRKVDLSTDAMFAKDLPKRLRQVIGDVPADHQDILGGTTDRREVQIYVRAAEIAPSRHEHLVAFCERLRAFSAALDGNIDIVEEIFGIIRDQPAVAQAIQREAERRADAARDRIRRDIEGEVIANWERENTALLETKQRLASELSALEDKNRAAIGRLSDTKKKAEAVERGIAEAVDGLRVVLDRAPKRSSDRARLIADHVEKLLGGGKNVLMPAELPPWSSGQVAAAKAIGFDELAGSISSASTAYGFEAADIARFDALMRAGEAVILAGPDRDAFLAAYASATTGAALRRMPLDFGIIGADDLWRQPGTGQPTAFAHAWVAARARPDIPVLVVLDEVQATSGWAWIGPLNVYLTAEDRPRNLLICMTTRCPRPDDSEAFRYAVGSLCRMAPKAKDAAAFRAARRQMAADMPEARMLTGMDETVPHDFDKADEVVADLADTANSICQAIRSVNVLKSAAVTMSPDQATAMTSDFLRFLSEDRQDAGMFAEWTKRFEEECAMRRPGLSGASHA